MKGYTIEVRKGGKVAMTKDNMLIKDEDDMENVEFWEDRLTQLKQAYVVAFREKEGRVLYSIFTKMRGKGCLFK